MDSTPSPKTVVQCDFDGTVTDRDVAFLMLDTFARGNWRRIHKQYEDGRITVGQFNEQSFALVRATREQLLSVIKGNIGIRPGFLDLVAGCRRKGFRLAIVSNGLDFYIESILQDLGVTGVEVYAARTTFADRRVSVQYIGPDGQPLDDGFKEAYVRLFHRQGNRVVYIGNGTSDFRPASLCEVVFATDRLAWYCRRQQSGCIEFESFNDVVNVLETL